MNIKGKIKKTWRRIIRNATVRHGVAQATSTIGAILLAALRKRAGR